MAIWQFAFDLVPSAAATVSGVVAARMSRDQLDSIRLDFSGPVPNRIIDRVSAILPEKPSWAPELRVWGDETTDDIQIGFLGAVVESVQFRLNVGDLSLTLISDICALARDVDCVLVTRGGAIVRPHGEALVRTILRSGAAHYVSDPERYLREAGERDPEPV